MKDNKITEVNIPHEDYAKQFLAYQLKTNPKLKYTMAKYKKYKLPSNSKSKYF